MSRAVVDLPQPVSPTTPSVSPLRSENEMLSTALTWPIARRSRTPRVTGKCLVSPSARSSSAAAVATGVSCCNYSLVGLTKALAAKYKVAYPAGGIPSIDSEINSCEVLLNGPGRDQCWAKMDQNMTTNVMAWVPYIWGRNIVITAPDVTRYVLDIATSSMSLTQIAVSNHATVGP